MQIIYRIERTCSIISLSSLPFVGEECIIAIYIFSVLPVCMDASIGLSGDRGEARPMHYDTCSELQKEGHKRGTYICGGWILVPTSY